MRDESIERFFDAYAERYMASDADVIADLYEVPFLAIEKAGPSISSIAMPSAST